MQTIQMTTYTRGDLMISSPDEAVVLKLASLAIGVKPAPSANDTPAIGEYWPGQGGIYVGIRHYPDGPHHLIIATEDLGEFTWGPRGVETAATSRVNGVLNTTTLIETDGEYPAATAAGDYSADGNHDFYLPSIGELNQVWQYVPELITEGVYWSSSQRSAHDAFSMTFDDGGQYYYGKSYELRVRPSRRLPI